MRQAGRQRKRNRQTQIGQLVAGGRQAGREKEQADIKLTGRQANKKMEKWKKKPGLDIKYS
jgi:hypothetical protein